MTDEERREFIDRMRRAAARGDSMGEFAAAERMSRGRVAGLKHRNGVVFGGDRSRHGERTNRGKRAAKSGQT